MGKNIALNYKAETRTNVAVFCLLLMLIGFFVSRFLLSCSIVFFGINALAGVHPRQWLKQKWWLWGVAWIGAYIVSGLWSSNTGSWQYAVAVKMPVLLLPLAFGLLPPFSRKQIRIFTVSAAVIFLATIGYSISFLLADPAYYIEQYRFSKVLPTLAGQDYIRYSLAISLFIVWCVFILKHLKNKAAKWLLRAAIVILGIYLHIIAVKTGILVLYMFVFLSAVYTIFRRKPIVGLATLALIILLAVGGYKYVPTFERKIDYFEYSWKVFKQGNYDSDYSDIGRLISYDVALKQLPDNTLAGTGIGDMHDVMQDGYAKWYPGVPEFQQHKPHNQFLIVALGCGIPALIIFLVWLFYPLKWVRRTRSGFFLFSVWLLMFIPLMTEPFLEVQQGVYVYLFFMLLFIHTARSHEEKKEVVA